MNNHNNISYKFYQNKIIIPRTKQKKAFFFQPSHDSSTICACLKRLGGQQINYQFSLKL